MSAKSSSGSGSGVRNLKQRVKTANKRSLSSQKWLERQLNDPYVARAKREGYRSRLSDCLNHGDLDFVPLVNVEISSVDPRQHEPEARPFLAIARAHIRIAHPFAEACSDS